MRCLITTSADGPDLDVPVLDYLLLIMLFLACLAPVFVLR
jgi:hypothetical protein